MADTIAEVDENTASHHPFSLLDVDEAPVTPELLRYRLMASAEVEIIPWTEVDVGTTTIVVPAASNIIGTTGKRRYLTLSITHNGGEIMTSEARYKLIDLKGI